MIGWVDGLKRSSTGGLASSGNCRVSILSRTSSPACCMSVPQANSSTTSLWPVREIDLSLRRPLTTPSASSAGCEIRVSTSAGAAPS